MTANEMRNLIKNIYAACNTMEVAAEIPAGEKAALARTLISTFFVRESIEFDKLK